MKRIFAIASALALALVSQTAPASAEWGPACGDHNNTAIKVWREASYSGFWDVECGNTSYPNTTEGSVADVNFGNNTDVGSIEDMNDSTSAIRLWNRSGVDVCVELFENNYFGGRRLQFYLGQNVTLSTNLHNYGAGDQVTSMWFDKSTSPSECTDRTW
jgi:hypothetical protein